MTDYQSSALTFADKCALSLSQFRSKTIMNSSSPALQTAVGWTAAVGISLVVLQLIGSLRDDATNSSSNRNVNAFYSFFRQRVRALFLSSDKDDNSDADDHKIVTHTGSCHCDSVYFKVTGPKALFVRQGSGKIRYPQARIKASKFRLIFGDEVMRIYHVHNEDATETIAYSFCRKCAVHIVNATDADESTVSFNVNCLHPGSAKLIECPNEKSEKLHKESTRLAESRVESCVKAKPYRNVSSLSVQEEEGDDMSFPTKEVLALGEKAAKFDVDGPLETESCLSGVTGYTSYTSPFEYYSTETSSVSASYATESASHVARHPSVRKDYPTSQMRKFMKKHMKKTAAAAAAAQGPRSAPSTRTPSPLAAVPVMVDELN